MLTKIISSQKKPTIADYNIIKDAIDQIIISYPIIDWVDDYTILGSWHHISVFRAQNIEHAMEVAAFIQDFNNVYSEVWPTIDMDVPQQHPLFA